MKYWAWVFFGSALVAGAVGFGGIDSASAEVAQILCGVFSLLLVAALAILVIFQWPGDSPGDWPGKWHGEADTDGDIR